MITRITILLSVLIAISSCTIQKQLHSRGFHVEFHKRQRSSDSPEAITSQPATKIAETELQTITTDSIIDAPSLQEKEEILVSEPVHQKVIPAIKSISGKLKRKIAAGTNKIRTAISFQTRLSETSMSKSTKKDPKKRSAKKSRDFDWGEFGEWMLILGGVVAFIFLVASLPGISFTEALVGVLVVILIIVLLLLLIASAIGDFEWFWSGR